MRLVRLSFLLVASGLWCAPASLAQSVDPPAVDPPAGTYSDGISVKLSSGTPGATIHFTTDGTVPTRSSPVFGGTPIWVASHASAGNVPPGATQTPMTTESAVVKAIAVKDGMADSAVTSASYLIDLVDTAFNIPYLEDGATPHLLDVYQPRGMTGTPVLFFVHGGGWTQGAKETYFELGNTFAGTYKMTTVVINYRLSPPGGTARHPDHINDVAAAFAWTVKNISRHGGDPQKIVIFGQSAGGHLVSLLATDPAYVSQYGLAFPQIKGVVTMSGAYELFDMADAVRNPLSLSAQDLAAYKVLFNLVFGGNSKGVLDAASPQQFASRTQPPFFVIGVEESEGFVDMPGFSKESRNFFDHIAAIQPSPGVKVHWLKKEEIPPEVLAIDIPDFPYDGHYHEIYAINTRNWNSVSTRIVADYVLNAVYPGQVVPVIVDVGGEGGTRFSTELTLTNKGTSAGTATLSYLSSSAQPPGTVGGSTSRVLNPGEQIVLPDTVAALAADGVPVVSGSEAGWLRVTWSGLSSGDAGSVIARTTTPSGAGRAGLSYGALTGAELANSRVSVFGLRENEADRSNLAVVNTGRSESLTLRITLHPGEPGATPVVLAPDVTLGPGEWKQISRVLKGAGLTKGYAVVDRVSGTGPFVAYGVFNDNVTGDGSFVSSVPAGRNPSVQVLPVVVETPVYGSELVLANPAATAVSAKLVYVESLDAATAGVEASLTIPLGAGEQKLIASVHEALRGAGASIGAKGGSYGGAVRVTFTGVAGELTEGFAGARTAAPGENGGGFGLFYETVPVERCAKSEAWVEALAESDAVRSNLAVVNAGSTSLTLKIEVFDGRTGKLAGELPRQRLEAGGWTQLNRILGQFGLSSGYVRVSRAEGEGPFLAYGVVNDNGTNDGSYLGMSLVK